MRPGGSTCHILQLAQAAQVADLLAQRVEDYLEALDRVPDELAAGADVRTVGELVGGRLEQVRRAHDAYRSVRP